MKNYNQILKQYYKKYLNREPDKKGFSHYLSLLETGELNEETLREKFINSDEYNVHRKIQAQLDNYPELTGTYSYYETKINQLISQYDNEPKITIRKNGEVYFVNSSNFKLFWAWLQVGLWEHNIFNIFDAFLDSNHSCIDLGAWIGPTVLYECQKARHCYAVEPDPVAFKILKSNIDCNPNLISRISLFNDCIMNSCGVTYLTPFGEGLGSSRTRAIGENYSHIYKPKFVVDQIEESLIISSKSLKINSITFQQFIMENSINDCNFIKFDIEGAEFLVLPEMLEFLKKEKPTICLSMHPTFMNNPKKSMEEIYNVIRVYDNIYDNRLRKVGHDFILNKDAIKSGIQIVISEKKPSPK
tara:strand:- start:552 stop:1625 length:1074 start_codon:yes stop_codon:yes gene_type:complete